MRHRRLLAGIRLALFIGLLGGCAPAPPLLAGAGTTPRERMDYSAGGSVRIPLGALHDLPFEDEEPEGSLAPGGVAPFVAARYGLTKHFDIGIVGSGTILRLDLRGAIPISDAGTQHTAFVFGLLPSFGWLSQEDADGERVGVEAPLLLTLDVASVIELWGGARMRVERVWGTLELDDSTESDASATNLSAGLVAGLGVGFRRFHALIELTAAYEHWSGEHDDTDFTRSGIALTPAFALRLRI